MPTLSTGRVLRGRFRRIAINFASSALAQNSDTSALVSPGPGTYAYPGMGPGQGKVWFLKRLSIANRRDAACVLYAAIVTDSIGSADTLTVLIPETSIGTLYAATWPGQYPAATECYATGSLLISEWHRVYISIGAAGTTGACYGYMDVIEYDTQLGYGFDLDDELIPREMLLE